MRRIAVVLFLACGLVWAVLPPLGASSEVFDGPVARAECGPGSRPEPALQGQVPLADRTSGRSLEGYDCNLEVVGQYQGIGAGWQAAWYDDCAYHSRSSLSGRGVPVIDVADPTDPKLARNLLTPAMQGPWESLAVNEKRGLLAAVAAYSAGGAGPVFFDLYDVSRNCADPQLRASLPLNIPIGHEGEWAPDGRTYYGSATYAPVTTAIDTSDPSEPRIAGVLQHQTHGLSISDDGNRAYMTGPSCGNGMKVVDVSQVQARVPNPQTRVVGEVCWPDGGTAQHTIPITVDGRPYVVFVDEGGSEGLGGCCAGAARIIDISDERKPRVVSKLKLEIHLPEHRAVANADVAGNGLFGYQGHYCGVDRRHEPTVLGCGYFQSGIRVFDIRDLLAPREIAYFNPPAQAGKELQLRGSEHAVLGANLSTDWCSAQVRFIPETAQLWTTCQDNGFLALRFTDGVWPFPEEES